MGFDIISHSKYTRHLIAELDKKIDWMENNTALEHESKVPDQKSRPHPIVGKITIKTTWRSADLNFILLSLA